MKAIFATITLLLCLVHSVDAFKTAAEDPHRPFYIPRDYLQVEAGDFLEYFEWWAKGSNRRIFVPSQYGNKTLGHLWSHDCDFQTDHYHNDIRPLRRERRYTLIRSDERKSAGIEPYDLLNLATSDPTFITVSRDPSSEDPEPSAGAFFCKHWWIVNATHVLDTRRLYEHGLKKEGEFAVFNRSYLRKIKDVQDTCLDETLVDRLQICFDAGVFCVMNEDLEPPELMLGVEHVLQHHRGVDLIVRRFNDTHHTNMPYYVLKFKEHYFYFPTTLRTFNEVARTQEMHRRVSLMPVLDNDRGAFWGRLKRVATSKHASRPHSFSEHVARNVVPAEKVRVSKVGVTPSRLRPHGKIANITI